jgi:dCTP deaminase
MTFLNDDCLRSRIEAGRTFLGAKEPIGKDPKVFWEKHLKGMKFDFIIITPFDEKRVFPASYELSLGNQYYATSDELPSELGQRLTPEYIRIEPGEFAVLTTRECIYVPTNLVAFISVKYGYKEQGLVNVSGFHVDPGFFGKLLFTVYNAGPGDIVLQAGSPIFLIMFAKLKERAEKGYEGIHQGQHDIPSDVVSKLRGTSVSPRNLDERLKKLELLTYVLTATVLPILVTLLLSVLGFIRR